MTKLYGIRRRDEYLPITFELVGLDTFVHERHIDGYGFYTFSSKERASNALDVIKKTGYFEGNPFKIDDDQLDNYVLCEVEFKVNEIS